MSNQKSNSAISEAKKHYDRLKHFFNEMPKEPTLEYLQMAEKEAEKVKTYLSIAKAFSKSK